MRRLRILTWHVHGSYLYYLGHAPHDIYVPVRPGRPAGYSGLPAGPFPWPETLHEVAAEEVPRLQLDCILYHHERFDGRGYPEGRAGTDIPFQARLLAVADALDALTSERAYRHRLTIAEAVDLLRQETDAGKWDPEVFAALAALAARSEADPRLDDGDWR